MIKCSPIDYSSGAAISVMEVVDAFTTLADRLEVVNLDLEPHFVKVGEDLQAVQLQSGNLEKTATDAVRLVSRDSDSSALRRVDEIAHDSISELRHRERYALDSLCMVKSVVAHLQQLQPLHKALLRIAKYLRAIGMCFAMESSRSSDSAEMFAAFTSNMNVLVDNVFEITNAIRSDARTAEEKQRAALEPISEGAESLRMLLQKADSAILDASERTDHIVGLAVDALEQVGGQSREVSRNISSIVTAIQFHDITRQQLEHIVAALRREAELLIQLTEPDTLPDEKSSALPHARSVLGVQVAQLAQVLAHIRQAHRSIEVSFAQIGEASRRLAESTSGICTSDTENNPFDDLVSALGSLDRLLVYGQQLDDKIKQASGQASEASIALSANAHQILEINIDIGIQAMNAIINSVHLDKNGNVLAALAQEVTKLSSKCSETVQRIVETLESITELAEQSGKSTQTRASKDFKSGIQQIIRTFDDFRYHSAEPVVHASRMNASIAAIERSLGFLDEVEDELGCAAEDMRELLEATKCCGDLPPGAGVVDTRAYTDEYTMKSERDVYRRFMNGPQTACDESRHASAKPASAAGESDDDLGANVELF